MKKKTCLICQPFGIGDILFIQKIVHYFADQGYRVVVPILDSLSWMRYYLLPRDDVEYPLIKTTKGPWHGDFEHAEIFLSLYYKCFFEPENELFKKPIVFNDGDPETGFYFIALSESYKTLHENLMPAKYKFVNLDWKDWADHVRIKRRPHVERELYYDVLNLRNDSTYTLVNEYCSSHRIPLSVPGNLVHLQSIDGFTVLDWLLVVEQATQIVTVDTSLVLLAEILKFKRPLHMVSRYTPPSFDPIREVLSMDWKLALTPDELKISAAG
jgi:hypothetical protein